jgi:hypothetical protein
MTYTETCEDPEQAYCSNADMAGYGTIRSKVQGIKSEGDIGWFYSPPPDTTTTSGMTGKTVTVWSSVPELKAQLPTSGTLPLA